MALQVAELGYELIEELRPLVEAIRRKDRSLADQLQRAASSICLNIAEADYSAGRLKAWRKQVKGGALPPVLLQWVSGLAAYIVLDGHDRLLASALEGAPAPALALEPVRETSASDEQKKSVMEALERSLEGAHRARSTDERLARARRLFRTEDANRILLDAFTPWERPAPARARAIRGGIDQWTTEVREALAARSISDTSLLDA